MPLSDLALRDLDLPLDALSSRQQEVLRLFCQRQNDLAISQALNVSEATVRKHLSDIHSKLFPETLEQAKRDNQVRPDLSRLCARIGQSPPSQNYCPCHQIIQAAENEITAIEQLQRLLEQGNDSLNAQDQRGRTPLFIAVEKQYRRVMEFLLQQPTIQIDRNNHYYVTPLHRAANLGQMSLIQLLLDHQANAQAKTRRGATTIYEAAFGSNYPEIVKVLEAAGADVSCPSDDGLTPLMVAIIRENYTVAEYLIERTPNLDAADYDGETAFYKAVKAGNYSLVTQLLKRGINYEKRPVEQAAIFQVDDFFKAVDQGDREKVHQLLAQGGVEINRKYTRYERTALHQAVLRGHFEVAKLLVERGADLFAYNNHGRTPREIALASHERLRNYLAEQEIKKMKN